MKDDTLRTSYLVGGCLAALSLSPCPVTVQECLIQAESLVSR